MKNINQIGLDANQVKELSNQLNDLLANYSIFYQNIRGFHWKVQGKDFFELHIKFEEIYTDIQLKIDEIAERILTLGFAPEHNYTRYLDVSELKEIKITNNGVEGVKIIIEGFQLFIQKQRSIMELSENINDEGTNALMSDYIREQEKSIWMFNAYLG